MPWLSRFHHKKVHTCPPTYTITHALPAVIHHLTRVTHAPPSTMHHPTPQSYITIIHHLTRTAIHHAPPYFTGLGFPTKNALLIHHLTVMSCNLRRSRRNNVVLETSSCKSFQTMVLSSTGPWSACSVHYFGRTVDQPRFYDHHRRLISQSLLQIHVQGVS